MNSRNAGWSNSKRFFAGISDGLSSTTCKEANAGPLLERLRGPDGRDVVLHVRGVTGRGGGPDKTILLSAARLPRARYFVAAAYMHPPDDPGFAFLQERSEAYECPLISIPDRGPLDLAVPRLLLEVCRRLNVRIWHAHEYKSDLFGLLLRRFYPMKLVATVHGWVEQTRRTRFYYALDRRCLRHYDHVIAVSPDLHDELSVLGVREDCRSLLLNGVDTQTFRRLFPAREAPLREQQGTPEDRLVVGAVGRLSEEKAFDLLIRTMPVLLGEGLDVELWIAGEGELHRSLQVLIDRLALAGRVKLMGFVTDMVALYHAMDVFALSSLREGLPNALLEAMSMEVPVAATEVAGVPAVIRDGENGLLCRSNDVADLGFSIRRLLLDAAMRETLARAARRTVEERFPLAARIDAEMQIYGRLLEDR